MGRKKQIKLVENNTDLNLEDDKVKTLELRIMNLTHINTVLRSENDKLKQELEETTKRKNKLFKKLREKEENLD